MVGSLAGLMAIAPFAARAEEPATEPVSLLDAGLLQTMRAGNAADSFEARCKALTPTIQRTFNLPAILQKVVGLRWTTMPSDQQHALLDAFTRFTVASYAANFSRYTGQHFDITGTRPLDTQQVVGTVMVDQDGSKVKMDYVVGGVNGYWQVTDVLLDGSISRAAVLRSDFRVLLSRGGAAALIQHLNDKSAALQNGQN